MPLQVKFHPTINKMVQALLDHAKQNRILIPPVTDVNELDSIFSDNGEARCEHFADYAIDYAIQFGRIESPNFDKAFWRVVDAALIELNKETMHQWVTKTLNPTAYYEALEAESKANEKQWRKTAYQD